MNSGSTISVSSVSRHSSRSMIVSTTARLMTFDTTVPERRGDRLLRADHVVVEARLERAGLRAGEERERHALHVVEQGDAQVVDEPLADP